MHKRKEIASFVEVLARHADGRDFLPAIIVRSDDPDSDIAMFFDCGEGSGIREEKVKKAEWTGVPKWKVSADE